MTDMKETEWVPLEEKEALTDEKVEEFYINKRKITENVIEKHTSKKKSNFPIRQKVLSIVMASLMVIGIIIPIVKLLF